MDESEREARSKARRTGTGDGELWGLIGSLTAGSWIGNRSFSEISVSDVSDDPVRPAEPRAEFKFSIRPL